ncbi:MAG: hypothetical protein RJQ03_05220, partial [Miltoncostaeaceae bacterium]
MPVAPDQDTATTSSPRARSARASAPPLRPLAPTTASLTLVRRLARDAGRLAVPIGPVHARAGGEHRVDGGLLVGRQGAADQRRVGARLGGIARADDGGGHLRAAQDPHDAQLGRPAGPARLVGDPRQLAHDGHALRVVLVGEELALAAPVVGREGRVLVHPPGQQPVS